VALAIMSFLGIRKDRIPTASALFGAAAIQTLFGLLALLFFSGSVRFDWLDRVSIFGGLVFIPLGIIAHWFPRSAALIGVGFYTTFLAAQASRSFDLLMSAYPFKIPVVLLLLVALMCALRRPSVPPLLPPGERPETV
jgi:hypothetical protein